MARDIKFYRSLKQNLEAVRDRYVGLWTLIASVLGRCESYGKLGQITFAESDTLDHNAYDPSCKRAVETVCDYYASLVFPTQNPFEIVPLAKNNPTQNDYDWFLKQSQKLVDALYNSKSGFLEIKPVFYRDWDTFGTAAFFVTEQNDDECPFVVQEFGIDSMAIQDGSNSQPEYAVLAFNWYPQVIVDYFGDAVYGKLPQDVRSEYESGKWDTQHMLYCVIHKNPDFNPKAKLGKARAKFKAVWFFENDEQIFAENEFFENPLAVSRYARIRGEVYGRSDVSNFINTVAAINGIIYLAYKSLSKMADPAIGIYDNALSNDTEIDTDAGAIVALDSTFASAANPIVPIQDIGDPSKLCDVLLTFLRDELAKAFKLDIILPIVQTNAMTATEFVNRLALQSEVLSGVLSRHLAQLSGFYERIIGICTRRAGFFDFENAPEYVKKAIANGEKWYQVKYNNSITNIMNSSAQRDFVNTLNTVMMAAQIDQSIAPDIDLYDSVLAIVKDSVLKNALPTKTEHEQNKAARQMQMAQAQQAQIANLQSQANRNNAQASNLVQPMV